MESKIVKEKVLKNIKEYSLIKEGDYIILGLSGGPDSVCLFDILENLTKEIGFTLHCAHINHGFRPIAADEDEKYSKGICAKRNIAFYSKNIDCVKLSKDLSISSEEAGRKARYDFFFELEKRLIEEGIKKEKIKIAVAHNSDDNVETVLFRILRGVGTDGLKGIEFKSINENGSKLIRPLLTVSKDEVMKYCEERHLKPCIDNTNFQPIYARNKIRLDLIPYLRERYNESIDEAIIRLSEIAKQDSKYIWKETEREYERAFVKKSKSEIYFKLDIIKQLEPSILHRVIIKAFRKLGLDSDISYQHLQNAEKLAKCGYTPQKVDFPKGFEVRISYENFVCTNTNIMEESNIPEIEVKSLEKKDYIAKSGVAAFDLELLEEAYGTKNFEDLIHIRTRNPGDFIRLSNGKGRKKIQNLFVDMKVDKNLRNQIHMVALGSEILWIPKGVIKERYSGCYKVTESTKRVITIEIKAFL